MKKIEKLIDHTNIDEKATEEDIKKTCQEAKKYGFRGVDINPAWVKVVSEEIKKTDIKTIVLIDPPMGISSHEERMVQVKKAKKDGADEIDIVMNIIDLKYERYDKVLEDLKEIAKVAPTKVIIGSGYLTDKEVKKASEIVKESGAFCVKTATEKDPLDRLELDEKAKHVKLMRETVEEDFKVKAAGKIRTVANVKMMVRAGADIIGTSASVQIMEEYNKKQ